MRRDFPTESIAKEDARLARIWIDSGLDMNEVVDKYANDEYKEYYYYYKDRKERALKEGRIIN